MKNRSLHAVDQKQKSKHNRLPNTTALKRRFFATRKDKRKQNCVLIGPQFLETYIVVL